jgi:hypothetical protein
VAGFDRNRWLQSSDYAASAQATVEAACSVASRSPALLTAYDEMLATLHQLRAGLDHLAEHQSGVRRGADETPDSLTFALEGLAAVWREQTGAPPINVSLKRGQFGGFALEALATCSDLYPQSAIKTALRRMQER